MDNLLLSDLERYYIIKGAEFGCRTDGRLASEYRPLKLETSLLTHANGSASIRIGETHILGCVKLEVGKPSVSFPDEGRIEINVECYPTATVTSTEKTANQIAENLKTTLQSAYRSDRTKLKQLCIEPGRQCWVIYVDLLLLEGGGNFLDASSIVVKAALLDATCFSCSVTANTLVNPNKNAFPNFHDKLPLFVTVHKVGNSKLVDASKEEESCSLSKLSIVVYPDGSLGPMVNEGCGSCYLETIIDMTELAKAVGCEMHLVLWKTLQMERELRS